MHRENRDSWEWEWECDQNVCKKALTIIDYSNYRKLISIDKFIEWTRNMQFNPLHWAIFCHSKRCDLDLSCIRFEFISIDFIVKKDNYQSLVQLFTEQFWLICMLTIVNRIKLNKTEQTSAATPFDVMIISMHNLEPSQNIHFDFVNLELK